jgi:hypothetical protein
MKPKNADPRGPKPCVITNLSNEDYHAMRDVFSKSTLDLFANRPARLKHRLDGGEFDESDAMRLGTAAHTALLEPGEISKRYRVHTEGLNKNTNAYKALKAEAEAAGLQIIDPHELEAAQAIADAVLAKMDRIAAKVGGVNPFRRKDGVTEASLFWTDKDTGLRLRTRPDWMSFGTGGPNFIIDLKTTRDAGEGFDKSTENFRYDVSAAFYSDGYEAVFGHPPDGYLLVCVESKAPHLVCVRFATPEILTRGRAAYKKDLAGIAQCVATSEWPDFPDDFVPMTLPKWAKEVRA